MKRLDSRIPASGALTFANREIVNRDPVNVGKEDNSRGLVIGNTEGEAAAGLPHSCNQLIPVALGLDEVRVFEDFESSEIADGGLVVAEFIR